MLINPYREEQIVWVIQRSAIEKRKEERRKEQREGGREGKRGS